MKDRYSGAHEFQARDEVVKISSERSFGLAFAGFFALLGGLSFYQGGTRWQYWLPLGVLFYVCITPIGFLMRLTGKDPMRRSFEPAANSYWIVRKPPGPAPETFRNQF